MTKLKKTEIAGVRKQLLVQQENRCAICKCDFTEGYYHKKKKKIVPKHIPCLDHCHFTGQVRGVLCRGCNSSEGVLINAIKRYHTNVHHLDTSEMTNFLYALANYYSWHRIDRQQLIHPDFKNEEEKRLLKNKRARRQRSMAKRTSN